MRNTFLKIGVVLMAVACVLFVNIINADRVYAKDADGDYVVVIDPGHGGGDAGAVSTHTGDSERTLNWNIALALKAELETYEGVKVYLTRGSSEYQSNAGRAQVGKSMNADLNVSVHNNSNTSNSPNGVIVYGTVDTRFASNIKNLCLAISKEISSSVGVKINNGGYGARSGSLGAGYDYYTFLSQSAICDIPSIIIEHCYLSNSGDAKIVHSAANQTKMGAADATVIARYLGLSKRTVSAGSTITLTRTYSAYMKTTKEGTYTSSNTAVASVRSDGLITAKKAGSATITCTAKDGTVETVNVTVPEVKLVGVAGGVVQSSYSSLNSYDTKGVCIKAIYSDGSAKQITSGYTLGTPYVYKTVGGGKDKEMKVCNVDITYQGLKGALVYYWYKDPSGISKHSASLANPGTNSDILVIPGTYVSSNPNTEIPTTAQKPTEVPTEKVTEKPTEELTSSVAESSTSGEEDTVKDNQETQSETEAGASSENVTEADSGNTVPTAGLNTFFVVCIGILVVLVIALGVIIYVSVKRSK